MEREKVVLTADGTAVWTTSKPSSRYYKGLPLVFRIIPRAFGIWPVIKDDDFELI